MVEGVLDGERAWMAEVRVVLHIVRDAEYF